MGEIFGVRCEHDLDQTCHLDLAQQLRVIDERDPPDLDVILGRDRDLELRLDADVRAPEHGRVGKEGHPVAFGLTAHRLIGRRPQQAAAHVPQVNELTARVAGRVVTLPRDRASPPGAGTAPGVGDDGGVLAVRQEVGAGVERVGGAESTRRRGGRGWFDARGFGGTWPDDGHEARHALLQQRLGGPHARVRMEAPHHRCAEHGVRQRDQAHALMMREEGTDLMNTGTVGHGFTVCRRGLARCVVERLLESELPRGALAREPAEVHGGGGGIDQRGERRRIGRNHQLLGQPALEPQARNAEGLVLVAAMRIHDVVSGLRDAPRHALATSVQDLRANRRAAS